MKYGSEKAVKKLDACVREGKEYIVQDGEHYHGNSALMSKKLMNSVN